MKSLDCRISKRTNKKLVELGLSAVVPKKPAKKPVTKSDTKPKKPVTKSDTKSKNDTKK